VRRAFNLILALVLLVGVGFAIFSSVRQRSDASRPAPLALVRGVIGSEKEPFFRDPAVVAAFSRNGLKLQVDTAGSREIATTFDLAAYDFAFPAGVPAADKIKRDRKVVTVYQPYFTPIAVATFKPIAGVLQKAGLAKPLGSDYWTLDMKAYLALVGKRTRWTDLPGNTAYRPGKSVLIASTDVRTSNSAAMYLAVASYVANGDTPVENNTQGDKIVDRVAPLFLRQGLQESSTEGPFEDYLTIGSGKTPMALIYEAQFLARKAAKDGSITDDRVLMYPDPTVFTKHTLVPLKPNGDTVGKLLTTDPELKRLAVKYGFRTADAAATRRYLAERGVPTPPDLVQVVEPPAYDALEHLIVRIQKLYQA